MLVSSHVYRSFQLSAARRNLNLSFPEPFPERKNLPAKSQQDSHPPPGVSQHPERKSHGVEAQAFELLFRPGFLLQVNLAVSLLLVAPGKPAATVVTGEGLLPRVRPDVRGQVVAAAEVPQADAALEGLVAGVDAQVAVQFIRPCETTDAVLHRAGEGFLVGFGAEAFGGALPPARLLLWLWDGYGGPAGG